MKNNETVTEKSSVSADIILHLHRELAAISEIGDYPERIATVISRAIEFDKLCVFFSGANDSSPTLLRSGDWPLPWDRIFPNIKAKDIHSSILYRGEAGDIFLSQEMKGPGCEGDENALGLIKHHSGMRHSIHLVLAASMGYRLHLSMFRKHEPFDGVDAETLKILAPPLTLSGKSLLSSWISARGDLLLSSSKENSDCRYIMLDSSLKVVVLPVQTSDFLCKHFECENVRALPATLMSWIEGCCLTDQSPAWEGERSTEFDTRTGTVSCSAYPFEDNSGNRVLLVALNLMRESGDFSPLSNIGLTRREIEILEGLYAGKTTSQVAEGLGIKMITVRKHLLRIGEKLHALGRTEILSKAINLCDEIPAWQPCLNGKPTVEALAENNRMEFLLKNNAFQKAVQTLNRRLSTLEDFENAPELIRYTLADYIEIDWTAVFYASTTNDMERVYFSSGCKCDWEKLHLSTRPQVRWRSIIERGVLGEVLRSHDFIDPTNEQDMAMKTVMEEATGAYYDMHMPVARTDGHKIHIGFYRNDPEKPFTEDDVAFVQGLSPVFISWAYSLARMQENTLKQAGCWDLLDKGHVSAALFDSNLCDVIWTGNAVSLLKTRCGPNWRETIIPQVREWIAHTGLLNVKEKDKARSCPENIVFEMYGLTCSAYPVQGSVVVNFKQHQTDPFSYLNKYSLTEREVQIVSFLPLGYTNNQIASSLGIREITVKKHLEKIGRKLGVSGRVGILRQAEIFRRSLNEH
ncbi:MAG TPA: helix-turn-helix transcriptional regulator [Desulfomonilia bacterium]